MGRRRRRVDLGTERRRIVIENAQMRRLRGDRAGIPARWPRGIDARASNLRVWPVINELLPATVSLPLTRPPRARLAAPDGGDWHPGAGRGRLVAPKEGPHNIVLVVTMVNCARPQD
jgi:hypothetical protein